MFCSGGRNGGVGCCVERGRSGGRASGCLLGVRGVLLLGEFE